MTERSMPLQLGLAGLLAAALLTFAPNAHAIIIRDDIEDAEYVVPEADYPAVVTLFPPDDCAATLFDPAHLLTVAHCAVDLTPGDILQIAGTPVTIGGVTLHPMWTDGDNYDIAVVRLEQAVEGVEPLPLYRGEDELGAQVTLVGRGTTGTGLEGESGGSSDGMLRRATNVVTQVDDLVFEVVFEGPREAGVTDLEGVGASGDSGGPVFLDVAGTPQIAGLNAFGDAPNGVGIGEYGATDHQTRVSAFVDWVDEVVAEADAAGGTTSSGAGSDSSGDDPATDTEASMGSGGAGKTAAESGCGCRHRNGPAGSWMMALAGLAMFRRRSLSPPGG